jgi:hypothetical protein
MAAPTPLGIAPDIRNGQAKLFENSTGRSPYNRAELAAEIST